RLDAGGGDTLDLACSGLLAKTLRAATDVVRASADLVESGDRLRHGELTVVATDHVPERVDQVGVEPALTEPFIREAQRGVGPFRAAARIDTPQRADAGDRPFGLALSRDLEPTEARNRRDVRLFLALGGDARCELVEGRDGLRVVEPVEEIGLFLL